MKSLLCTAAMALALAAGPALAQTKDTGAAAATAQASVPQQDKTFADKAARAGLAEVALGKLAADKATQQDVKQFGQRMVDDHGKANDRLKEIAGKKDITLPTEMDAEHKQMRDRLADLSGDAFGRQYMQAMVSDHQKAIDLFQKEASQGQDADLKRFAEETLPVLQEHLKMAQDIRQQMQPVASAAGAAGSAAEGQSATVIVTTPGQTTAAPVAAQTAAAEATMPEIDSKLGAMTAEELIGKDVVNAAGDQVGEIEDVVIDDQKAVQAVVSVGGFLGFGAKEVVVPFHQLRMGEDDTILMSEASEEELEKMPEFKKDAYDPLPPDRTIVDR